MADTKEAVDLEHRLTTVERDLAGHIKTCEANSNEIKWWVRALGIGGVGFLGKLAWTWLTTHH